MENKNISIDLSMLEVSLKEIKENLNVYEFEEFLELLMEANDKEKLEQFLERAREIHSQGTDLASSLNHAHYDLFVDQEEKF